MTKEAGSALAENNNTDISSHLDDDLLKFLTFAVDDGRYGVDILSVREIKGWENPTQLPNSPEYMKGVINLRGVVIPIFDLKKRFGTGETSPDPKNVIIILAAGNDKMIGILVDAVSDIIECKQEDIKDSPDTDTNIDDKFIKGLISDDDFMTILLDTGTLFSNKELSATYDVIKKQNSNKE